MDDSPAVPGIGLGELRAALSSADPAKRASALARAHPEPGVDEAMVSALRDASEEVRRASIRALARVGTPAAIRAVATACVSDLSPAVRGEAVSALGRMLASGPRRRSDSSDLQSQ
jgi:HEAT repeat protein